MKTNIIRPDGGFEVSGPDAATIVRLIGAPDWVAESIMAWQHNDGSGSHAVHFGLGCAVIVLPEAPPVSDEVARARLLLQRKVESYSDYHKAFYGMRPGNLRGATDEEIGKAYDLITEEFDKLKATPEGRARLRANGWELPPEPTRPPAKKAAKKVAKKAARKAPAKKVARRKA